MAGSGTSIPLRTMNGGRGYHAVTMPSTATNVTTQSFWQRVRCCASDQPENTALIEATKNDEYEDCKRILEEEETEIIDVQDKDTKQTALHYAAENGKLKHVKLFLQYNADCNAQDTKGNTPLHLAILQCKNLQIRLKKDMKKETKSKRSKKNASLERYVTIVDKLSDRITKYDDSQQLDDLGNTLLHLAAEGGHHNTCIKLLQLNADNINVTNKDGNTPLHLAVIEGKDDIIRLLQSYKAKCNIQNQHGEAPLHLAATGKNLDCFTAMLEFDDLEIDFAKNDSSTPLHCAAEAGNSEVVDKLLARGADCNAKNSSGNTPLHCAAKTGNSEVVKQLLTGGADCNAQDESENTPLHCAAKTGNSGVVTQLLAGGADCNAKDKLGNTPLLLALAQEHTECCEQLLECNSLKINEKNKSKESALHIASMKGERNICDNILKKSDVDIDIKNKGNETPLHTAARQKNEKVLQLLLEKGANWKLRNKKGYMPLHYAAENGSEKSCELLVKAINEEKKLHKNKKISLTLRDKRTPLMLAANGGFHHCCEKLLFDDMNINQVDNYGNTALFYALRHDFIKTVELLVNKGADVTIKNNDNRTVLHQAVKYKTDSCLNYLLQCPGIEDLLKVRDNKSGYTPIHEAITSEAMTCAEMLLKHNASITEKCNNGMSPLHMAAKQGDPGICLLLVSRDEDSVNEINDDQETPLHLAAMHGHREACKTLLRKGTKVYAKDKNDRTALHLAALNGHDQVLTMLIRKGTSPHKKDNTGSTPLHLAATNGHLKCCQVLVACAENLIQVEDNEHNLCLDKAFENKKDEVFAFLINKFKQNPPPKKAQRQFNQPGELSEKEKRIQCFHKYMHQALTPHNQKDHHRVIAAEAIIDSDWWQTACFPGSQREGSEKANLCTCFKDLINNHPSLALKIQERYFQTSSHNFGDIKNFRLFEDIYCQEPEQKTSEKQRVLTDGERLLRDHPVSLMVQHKHVKLLLHQLTDAWLMNLWRTYICCIFTCLLVIEVAFLSALHTFMYNVDNWSRAQHICKLEEEQFCDPYLSNSFNGSEGGSGDGMESGGDGGSSKCVLSPSSSVLGYWIFLLTMTLFILLLEFTYLYRLSREYFRMKRLVRIVQLTLTAIFLAPGGVCGYFHPVLYIGPWYCGIIALLLEWIILIQKLNQIPLLFVFMPITRFFLLTYIKALAYILSLLFVFSYIFHLLLANATAFSNVPQSMMKMITWVLGDLNYEDTFVNDDVIYPHMGKIMFVAFIIIMLGFIANLAIGQPSDRVNEYKNCARYYQVEAQSNLYLEIQACFPRLKERIIKYFSNLKLGNNFADKMANTLFKPNTTDKKSISQETTLDNAKEQMQSLINLFKEQKDEIRDMKQEIAILLRARTESVSHP